MKLDMDTADDFINLALRDIRPDITPPGNRGAVPMKSILFIILLVGLGRLGL